MRIVLAALCLLATLGQGGGAPGALAAWHAALAACAVWALLGDLHHRASFPELTRTCFGLFAICVALGAARAPYGYAAWLQCLELSCWAAAAVLASRAAAPERMLRTLSYALLAGGSLQGLLAVGHVLVGRPGRPAGTFLNPNHMGLWLAAAVLLGIGVLGERPSRRCRWALALGLPPALAAIALSGSRGAVLGLLAGGGWLAATRWSTTPRRWRLAAVACAAALIAVAGWKMAARVRDGDPFQYQRLRIWKAAAAAVLDDPWWGRGPGQLESASANLQFPDDEEPLRYDRRFTTTHSDALRAPVELGIPGTLALAAAIVSSVASLARRRRCGTLPAGADGALAALAAIAAHSLVDNPSTWPAVYVLAAVLAGIVLPTPAAARAEARLRPMGRLALAATVLAVVAIGDLAPYLAWRQAAGLPRGRLEPDELARLKRAAALNRTHAGWPLRLAEHVAADPAAWSPAQYAMAREWAERSTRADPLAAQAARALARVEARACLEWGAGGCPERVREHYERAAGLARFDPTIPIELAKFLLDAGDPAGARRPAERALVLEPESVVPRLLLADVFLRLGTPAARAAAQELLAEAAARAERWSAWNATPYGRALLTIEPRVASRLEAALGTTVRR